MESNFLLILFWVVVVVALVVVGWRTYRQQRYLRLELARLRQHASATAAEQSYSEGPVVTDAERNQVFLSYSQKDENLVEELRVHLSPILRKHQMRLWVAPDVAAGGRVGAAQKEAIAHSSIAIAVVSPEYLASEFIQGEELPALIRAHQKSALRLLWLPLRPSAVDATGLANYQALLNPGRPLSMLSAEERGVALVMVAEGVARYLEKAEKAVQAGDSHEPWSAGPIDRLAKVRLRNIRCFQDITLDLNVTPVTGGHPLPSLRTVLVGDNATGKSTVLRSIALGMCDESGATALLTKIKGRMIRSGATSGTIELHFCPDDSNRASVVVTEIVESQSKTEVVRKSGDRPPPVVLVGYGTQRTRSGTRSHERYDVATAVGTLFDDDATLQNPELVLLRQPRWIRNGIQEMVAGILGVESDKVEYRSDALRIAGPWGRERVEVLSDGYRSTTQWILDFANWFVYSEDSTSSPGQVSGIVLMDELEQHLHPHWQRTIISRLRKYLPRVQFLITSHSPLIASSVTGLDPAGWREKLVYFGSDHGKVVPAETESLRGMNVQQVLASPAFDYLVDADPSVSELFAEASRLASKGDKRSRSEEDRYQRVKGIVGEILVKQDTTLVEQEARKDLHKQTRAKIKELESEVFGDKR